MAKKTLTIDDLKKSLTLIVGAKHILFPEREQDSLLCQPYLEESRGRSVGKALAIIFPSSTEEVAQVVATCRHHKTPVVPQGGNTGRCLAAQTDDENAVVINLKNLNKIRQLDEDNLTITVEAGCILSEVQDYAAQAGLFFPLSLGSEGSCQIGGNLATNAGGINVLRYGNARELTLGVEVVTANGTVLNELYGLRKNNTGYDLKNLVIGSEGTLGIITAVTLKLFPPEMNNEHAFIAVNDIDSAVQCLRSLQQCFGNKISTFELMPKQAMDFLAKHSELRCPINADYPWYVWYKIADSNPNTPLFEENLAILDQLMKQGVISAATVAQNESMKQNFAKIRETIVEVQKCEGHSIKFDVSVPVSAIATLVEKGNAAARAICPDIRPYPFGHVGDGNLHYNFNCPVGMDDETYRLNYQEKLQHAIYDIIDGLDGSFSAEHGIGSQKLAEMKYYKDPVALDLMRRIKHAFDPFYLMNPGKVIPPLKKKYSE